MYEIFNPVDGRTQGYKRTEADAIAFCKRCEPAFLDYLPARDGYYIVDMRGNVKEYAGEDYSKARNKADYLNMGSDTNSYSVVPFNS